MKHELLPDNEALITTRAPAISFAPAVSLNFAVNVWDTPLPELGDTETGTGGTGGVVTVQEPTCAQRPVSVALCPSRKILFGPAKALLNVMGTVNVRLLPNETTEDVPTLSVH